MDGIAVAIAQLSDICMMSLAVFHERTLKPLLIGKVVFGNGYFSWAVSVYVVCAPTPAFSVPSVHSFQLHNKAVVNLYFSPLLQLLEDVGFVNVRAEDRTDQFVNMLKKELQRMKDIREDFIKVLLINFR